MLSANSEKEQLRHRAVSLQQHGFLVLNMHSPRRGMRKISVTFYRAI